MTDFGICRMGVIPIRSEASHKSEMVSQLLFGEHYKVLSTSHDGEWFNIQNEFDGYTGWIAFNQHNSIPEEYYTQITGADYKISLDVFSTILYKKSPIVIPIGSIIPIATNELFKMEEHLAFAGESKSLNQKREYEYLKQVAFKFLNVPYLWGGRSPLGIDCSGFVQLVLKICGYSILRDTYQQVEEGTKVKNLNVAQPGDLAFFKNDKGKVDHVGIVLDDMKIIHASGRVRVDILSDEGISNSETGVVTHKNLVLRRVI